MPSKMKTPYDLHIQYEVSSNPENHQSRDKGYFHECIRMLINALTDKTGFHEEFGKFLRIEECDLNLVGPFNSPGIEFKIRVSFYMNEKGGVFRRFDLIYKPEEEDAK
jgi:hypothetical protein